MYNSNDKIKSFLTYCNESDVEFIEFRFSDKNDEWHSVSYRIDECELYLQNGIDELGLSDEQFQNIVLIPDLDLIFFDPILIEEIIIVPCNMYNTNTKKIENKLTQLSINNHVIKRTLLRYSSTHKKKYVDDINTLKQVIVKMPRLLLFVSDELQNDKEFILESMEYFPDYCNIFQYLNNKLSADKEIVFKAIKYKKHKYNCFNNMHNNLKKDKEVILQILAADPYHIDLELFIIDELKNDKDFAVQILKINGNYLKHFNFEIKTDKELVSLALKNGHEINFHDINSTLKVDKEIVLSVLKNRSSFVNLDDIDDSLKSDKEIVLSVLDINPYIDSNDIDDTLRNDKDFILKVCKKNLGNFIHASHSLQYDKDFIIQVLRSTPLNNTKEFISIIKSNLDDEIIFEIVKKDLKSLEFCSPEFKSNKVFMIPIIQNNIDALQYANYTLLDDKEFILALINHKEIFESISDTLMEDTEFILEISNYNIEILKQINITIYEDINFLNKAIVIDPNIAKYVINKINNFDHTRYSAYMTDEAMNDNKKRFDVIKLNLSGKSKVNNSSKTFIQKLTSFF